MSVIASIILLAATEYRDPDEFRRQAGLYVLCFSGKTDGSDRKGGFFHFTTGENKPDLIFSSPEPGSVPWFEQGKVTEVAVDELPNGKSAAIKILGKANNHDATLKLLVSNRGDDIKLQLQENGKDIEEFGCVRSVPPPPPKEGIK